MAIIKEICALEVLDSRGIPTILAEVILENNYKGTAMVPSGSSTGSLEACELRDHEKRFMGKGVRCAINNIENIIRPKLLGRSALEQIDIDQAMIGLDGTPNKAKLGANAILAVSIATAKAAAVSLHQDLYQYLNSLYNPKTPLSLPMPMMNIINGGVHADNNLSIQEFMIVPIGADSFSTAMQYGVEVFYALKSILKKYGKNTAVGDEGGFAPLLASNKEAIEYILNAIETTGLKPGIDVSLALDAASTEFYNNEQYYMQAEDLTLTSDQLITYYQNLTKQYPIYSIEDALAEDDWAGWKLITENIGQTTQLVGDDVFVTNTKLLARAIEEHIANAILVKMNQIGTITETFAAIKMAQEANYATIISHRSGETEDTTIADLAVATNAKQIKTGSLCRSERMSKYNRLLKIESELGNKAVFGVITK